MNSATKAAPMTKDEAMLLIQLVATSAVITNKATNASNNKLKDQAWQTIAVEFNSSVSSSRRIPAQLRLKWENLKKAARKRCAEIRINHNKTGGGKDYFPPDEVLDKVASLLGSTCQGFSVEYGGDATEGDLNLVMGDVVIELGDGGDGCCGEGVDERDVLKEIQIIETPPPPSKQKNFFLNRASGSGSLAKRKQKMEEEKHKARLFRDNALAELLIVKKRKIDLENEEKELNITKLKLELENARLENVRLKKDSCVVNLFCPYFSIVLLLSTLCV